MPTYLRCMIRITAVAALFALAGCGAHGETAGTGKAGAQPDTALLAAADLDTVARHDLSAGVPVSGTLTPGWQARVTAALDDVLQDVVVREGQRVGKGEVLAHFRLGSVEADAASARAQLRSATADWERQKNLLAEGAVSERDVETATVRAPGAGVVTTRSVQTGDRVSMGDPLFVVADTRTLEFEATVPSELVSHVRVGAAVVLTASGFPSGAIHGRVARVSNTADDATRQVKVYASVPNADGRLVGDLYASGSIVVRQAPGVLSVPAAAVRRDGETSVAWVLGADGRLARRTLKPGLRDEAHDLVQVLEGLIAGDRVLVGPVEGLAAGQPARVTGKER
jgi:membrane fusion protein (multidrug efflux system)